jgi:hypothetical protein
MSWMEQFNIDHIRNGTSGPWKISRFTITKQDASTYNLGMLFNGHGARQVAPGTYVRLSHETRGIVMSNTDAELRDHIEPWQKAKGHCLIMGLGLGMITSAVLRKKEVEQVTVVERDEHVITLVEPSLRDHFSEKGITIVQGDALTWHPPRGIRYGMVWHDIWDTICGDNKPEMSKLHRRYGKLSDWQGSWGKWEIERMMREDRRYGRPW